MVQLSTTYFILMAALVAAVVVAAAAAATDPDPEGDSDPEADPTTPPVTDNPRCKHPLFCRQRPPMFGQRLRPSLPTTTPSTTTTRRSTSRFSARPNLYSSENLPQVNNTLQSNTKTRFSSRTTPAPTEVTTDPQTADIEDFQATEERTTPFKRNRFRVTTPERLSSSSKTTPSQPDNPSPVTTQATTSATTRRRLPVTMARHRTNAAKVQPKTTSAPELEQENDRTETTTVSLIADCPDGVCTTIKRIPGATVVVRKKKIRPIAATTEAVPVTELTSINVPQEDTTISQTFTTIRTVTRRPFLSNRNPGLFKSRTQRLRDQTSTTPKPFTDAPDEVVTNPVTQTTFVRKHNINKLKNRKKITTTPEPFDNTEYPTTQSWREVLNPEEVPTRNSHRQNKKCGKSCRVQTTTPEPENYPTEFLPLRPLKQRNEVKSVEQQKTAFLNTNGPKVEYNTETESPYIPVTNSFPVVSPVIIEEVPITTQYLKEVTPTTEKLNIAPPKNTNTVIKDFGKSKNSVPVQTKTRTGKNSAEGLKNDNFNKLESVNKFSQSHSPQTPPSMLQSTSKPNDFSGYKYSIPEMTFNPTTKKPFQQTTKKPVYEVPKNMGGYVYPKPTTSFARPTTARPRPQTTPPLGLNSYIYSRPQMPYMYPTTMKTTMQESTSYLPMLLQKKKEVLENTPLIGPAMTTVRNIINFITKPEEMFAKKYQSLHYKPPFQYPTTFNPMTPQSTYPPYMTFPPYLPRNTFQKQTSVDNGFKLKAKPRKKGHDENCTMKTPSGFEALTMRTVSSPRPFKKQVNEPYPFESTSSQYDTASRTALKAEASTRHHHYRSPSRGKHAGRGNSSGRKTRTRSSRRRCQNMRCRSSRQHAFRSEDASIFVPVSSIMKVKGPKVRTKRQDSNGEGYVYPRPTLSPTIDSPELVSPTRPASTASGSSTLKPGSNPDEPFEGYDYSKPSGRPSFPTPKPSSGSENKPDENFEGYEYTKPSGKPSFPTPGVSTPKPSSGPQSNPDEPFEGYEYSKPSGGSTLSTSLGSSSTTTSTSSGGPSSTSKSPSTATPVGSNGPEENFEGYDYPKPSGATLTSSKPSPAVSGGSNKPDESFEGYDYPKPSGATLTNSKPSPAVSGGSNLPDESFEGYDYSKPAKPFLPEPGSSPLPESEKEGYDYPKPSKRLTT